MDLFNLVRAEGSGGSLMPILIFVIWLVISMYTNAQAKKKKQQAMEQRERERAQMQEQEPATYRDEPVSLEPSPEMSQEEDPEDEQYETTLEEVAIEESPVEYNEKKADQKAIFVEESQSLETSAPLDDVNSVFPARPIVSDIKPYQKEYELGPSIADTAIGDIDNSDSFSTIPQIDSSSSEEIRKAIVWSEILAKPKSLHEV